MSASKSSMLRQSSQPALARGRAGPPAQLPGVKWSRQLAYGAARAGKAGLPGGKWSRHSLASGQPWAGHIAARWQAEPPELASGAATAGEWSRQI